MDGTTVEHSDSDSGESWTILEHSPAYASDAPDFAENAIQPHCELHANVERDEDTDGISVISDSEPELSMPCDLSYDHCLIEDHPGDRATTQYISLNTNAPDNNDHEDIRTETDFLGDNTGKHKTYVHRRNKRLSTVLNIIMLGSVITAAGVAIGHMWGARNDCTMHTPPSVNKILSNLYKLQEENAYLRNKLKEFTLASSIQLQKKPSPEKLTFKQQRCKKVFEEPLTSNNVHKPTKCIDKFDNHLLQPEFEKEFLNDVEKLKNIYQQNKSWLDEEIARRMKNEGNAIKKVTSNIKTSLSSIVEEQKGLQDENMDNLDEATQVNPIVNLESANIVAIPEEKKITYADSLKSTQRNHRLKREANISDKVDKNNPVRKKVKPNYDVIVQISEEEIKKDDRYKGHMTKQEKKKRDRQKLHKKQKRKNKYEQWEMKGGYMKDYDEFSFSSQDNDSIWKKPDKNYMSREADKNIIQELTETKQQENKPKNEKGEKRSIKMKGEEINWFDKRAVLRTEARKKLEHELFGETSPNNAGWYFRRMQRREQCRAKSDNGTYKKLLKRNIMNFKTKH